MAGNAGAASRRYPVGIAAVRNSVGAGVNAAFGGQRGTGGAGFGVMSARVDITDRESLEAWLEDQPREVAVWIASRAAARVLPLWWDWVQTEGWAKQEIFTPLTALRQLLISCVYANMPTIDLEAAAVATLDGGIVGIPSSRASDADGAARAAAAVAAFDKPARAAGSAGFCSAKAAAAVHGADNVWSAIRTDVKNADKGIGLTTIPLWSIEAHPLKPEWNGI